MTNFKMAEQHNTTFYWLKEKGAPMLDRLFSVRVSDWLGSRNGLFYAFPYTALGMIISKSPGRGKEKSLLKCLY